MLELVTQICTMYIILAIGGIGDNNEQYVLQLNKKILLIPFTLCLYYTPLSVVLRPYTLARTSLATHST